MIRVAFVIALCFPASSFAQDNQAKLGPEHERLKEFVGKWDLTMEGGPGKGTAEFKSIFGGRFLTEESKLPFGNFSMEWMGIYGYDTHKKKYTAAWVDNMDTTTEIGEAEAEPTGNTLNFRGEHRDPRTGKPAKFIWRLTRTGDSKLTIEMFDVDAAGKEQKAMTIHGEKSKAPANQLPK